MKQILCLLILIGLFSFLHSEIMVCPLLKGICCTDFNSVNSCKCVDSKLPECRLYSVPCEDKSQKRIYTRTQSSLQTKCVS